MAIEAKVTEAKIINNINANHHNQRLYNPGKTKDKMYKQIERKGIMLAHHRGQKRKQQE